MNARKAKQVAHALFSALPEVEKGAKMAIDAANVVLKVTDAVNALKLGKLKIVIGDEEDTSQKKATVSGGRIRW